ncbi:hypothetical protein BGZ67_000933, partial [Mortierella alpina]
MNLLVAKNRQLTTFVALFCKVKQGLDAIKKGDEYRDRGDFDKAKAKYEKATKFHPAEAHDRLAILPL